MVRVKGLSYSPLILTLFRKGRGEYKDELLAIAVTPAPV
jgi:hypothetical protein